MLNFSLSSALLVVTDLGFIDADSRLSEKPHAAAFLANYALQGGRICKKSTSNRKHQARWPTFASVKPNGDDWRDDKEYQRYNKVEKW